MIAWRDGAWIGADAPSVSLLDRGFALGDGLFETVLWEGGALRRLPQHARRLAASAKALGLPAPPGAEAIEELCTEVIARNDLARAIAAVRLTWSSGVGARGVARPAELHAILSVSASVYARPAGPAALATVAIRRNETAPSARHKTLSYVDAVMARAQALEAGADEALQLNARGNAASAACATLFLLIDGRLRTPPLSEGALPGVTRACLLARDRSLDVRPIMPQDIARAEAGAIANALLGVRPISRIDARLLDPDNARIRALSEALG